jgi:hypothetical protein
MHYPGLNLFNSLRAHALVSAKVGVLAKLLVHGALIGVCVLTVQNSSTMLTIATGVL